MTAWAAVGGPRATGRGPGAARCGDDCCAQSLMGHVLAQALLYIGHWQWTLLIKNWPRPRLRGSKLKAAKSS